MATVERQALADIQAELRALAALLAAQPPEGGQRSVVQLLDAAGQPVGEPLPAVSPLGAQMLARAAQCAGWHTRTGGAR